MGDQLETVTITSFEIENPDHKQYYDVEIRDEMRGGSRKIFVKVTPTESIPTGRIRDTLVIYTDLDQPRALRIGLTGEMLGPIAVDPGIIHLVQGENDEAYTGSTILSKTSSRNFTVESVQCEDDRIEITTTPPNSDGAVTITATLKDDGKKLEPIRTALLVKTDTQDQPELNIPVYLHYKKITLHPEKEDE